MGRGRARGSEMVPGSSCVAAVIVAVGVARARADEGAGRRSQPSCGVDVIEQHAERGLRALRRAESVRPEKPRGAKWTARCSERIGHTRKKCCTVSGSSPHVGQVALGAFPVRSMYACSGTWLVRNCMRKLACCRGRSAMSAPYFLEGRAPSISAIRTPRRDVRHRTPARRSSSCWKFCRARDALSESGLRSYFGSRCLADEISCADSFAASSAASFPGTSEWPGTQGSVRRRPGRAALRSRTAAWKMSVR